MCYFVEINLSRAQLELRFNVPALHDPRYMETNMASAFLKPFLPVILQDDPNHIRFNQWGLIPSWVKNQDMAEKISLSTFNARGESIFEKPSFRSAASRKRCMVLVHGFFEWHHKAGNEKIPYYIKRKDDQAFALAGLSENWADRETGEFIDSVSIVTTNANPMMEKIHNSKKRMPVILPGETEKEWINPELNKKQVKELIKPSEENELIAFPVKKSSFLNPASPLDPELIKEYSSSSQTGLFGETDI